MSAPVAPSRGQRSRTGISGKRPEPLEQALRLTTGAVQEDDERHGTAGNHRRHLQQAIAPSPKLQRTSIARRCLDARFWPRFEPRAGCLLRD